MGSRLGKKKNDQVTMEAYRFHGVPQEEDYTFERKTFGCCRYLWNRMLGDHNTLYKEIGEVPDNTPADYKDLDECSWLKEVDSLALANVQLNQARAFSAFYDGKRGYPKFKSKKDHRFSYTTNAVYSTKKGITTCNIVLDEEQGTLKLPKHRHPVILTLHRKVRPGGKLKSVTVTQEPDGKFYYSILMEYPKQSVSVSLDEAKAIGLDMSLPELYVDDRGQSPDFPKPYRRMEKRLAMEQKKLDRKKKGSANYEAQRKKVARLHAIAKHQRQDLLHKLSCILTDEYDILCIEDLDMSAMKKALKFGKAVSDNGWGMFCRMLEYKAERKGKMLIRIDKWFPSSKTCSRCGHKKADLTLGERTYFCPSCGHVLDRDENAGINIKMEGLRIYRMQTAR